MASERAVDERLVVQVWERQAFDPSALLPLRVIFRGVPSDAGGPDYQGAILSLQDRELIQGDIEFHVRSSDWYRHGHHHNPRYDRVVLHVVWTDDSGTTRRADGSSVPILPLSGCARMVEAPRRLLSHPCVDAFGRVPPETLQARIREIGLVRFRSRAEHFESELTGADPDQVAYTAILEAMGYASNRPVYRALAEAVPFAWLIGLPSTQHAPTLLDGAGLGPPAEYPPPAHLPRDRWRLVRLRPGNHPARRLAGVAELLHAMGPHLADALVAAVLDAGRPSHLRQRLVARDGQISYIGVGRADELAVSVVLPLVAALAPESGHPIQLFESYPSPPSNRWTRLMEDLLAQAGHHLDRRAAEHQGLHHLYHTFCRHERRVGCPVCHPSGNAFQR